VARNAVLTAGWPESVPGTTVDRQCGSGQQAIHFAAQGVMSGVYDAVVAGGVEVMSQVPLGASIVKGMGFPFPPAMLDRYKETGLPPQGIGAEMIADQWSLSRSDIDAFAAASQQRAERATAEGRFEREIVPVPVVTEEGEQSMVTDEGIRPGTTVEKLAALKPAFKEDGKITAGNSSQITDGAAALVLASARRAKELGLKELGRLRSWAFAGCDPARMGLGPVLATPIALRRAGDVPIDRIDLVEINEAFAVQVIACLRAFESRDFFQRHLGTAPIGAPDPERLNVNGGAIALGHPVGATGGRLVLTLLEEMARRDASLGLATLCVGGGQGGALVLERS
jgi:acetyl-CoA acyltransferase